MKFLTVCDYSGMVECELFADTYRRFGINTVRFPVVELTATVTPFDNGLDIRCKWSGWEDHEPAGNRRLEAMAETEAHKELKRLAVIWARGNGYACCGTEIQLPHSGYRVDVAGRHVGHSRVGPVFGERH